ncbi:MAG: DUF4838 domain-containing protein [Planctomycetota bacterium]
MITAWQRALVATGLIAILVSHASVRGETVIVRDGEPVATVVVRKAGQRKGKRRRRGFKTTDAGAAQVLVDWVKKMTDAELPVADQAPQGQPAIYVGRAAVEAGLDLDAIESPTNEGVRIVAEAERVLIAGQSGTATVKAVCRFLEELGCRYFMDHPLGEVYPMAKTLTVGTLAIAEQPGFRSRRIWGSTWTGMSLWKIWNGAGGERFDTRHAWGAYFDKELFDDHPAYFRMNAQGERQASDWLCTSNPEVRRIFAGNVIQAIDAGARNPSISPPDGRGYCQCPTCKAQDDPKSIEPSSGTVCVTNRYCDFFDAVGRAVAKKHPDAVLNFYAYADYTQPPTFDRTLSPNLCAWLAPIRYCRYHAIASPVCPSRTQLGQMLDRWAEVVSKIGYRTYNYNLAECSVPYSKIAIWAHDIPYLKRKGCIGVNFETLHSWHIYAPHIYLSIRLAYDPDADAQDILDDYFARFFGPKAGPPMKAYWAAIDDAFVHLKCHSGSFFAIHRVYTPEFIGRCRQLLDQAAQAAKGDESVAARVQLFRDGLRNAIDYMALREAMNQGDFPQAKRVCDAMIARNDALVKRKLSNHYTPRYIRRFVAKIVDAGAEAVAPPSKLLAVLPDRWRMAYDDQQQGEAKGYHKPAFDDSDWRQVATYSDTLDGQGLPDRKTLLWYRTRFAVPEAAGKLALFVAEIDGGATVYVNGQKVGEQPKKRRPFEVDITQAAHPGKNVVAVRCDHRKITELFLGGILRPVLLIAQPE